MAKPYTRIARCRLYYRFSGRETPVGLGGLHHAQGNPVFDASVGIETLEFGIDINRRIRVQAVDFHKAAYGLWYVIYREIQA